MKFDEIGFGKSQRLNDIEAVTKSLGTAANKDVGTDDGQLPLSEQVYKAAYNKQITYSSDADINTLASGERVIVGNDGVNIAPTTSNTGYARFYECQKTFGERRLQKSWGYAGGGTLATRTYNERYDGWSPWCVYHHTQNTTVDSNGFIKAASPIVKLSANGVELNALSAQQSIEFVKNGVGDYTLKNTSGFADDGWYIELPKDANGNPKFAVIYDDNDGEISVKTYKRKFDFDACAVVADLDNPVDIPDGRWIDIRLNDLDADDEQARS